jgi:hypothetical protein
VKSTPGLGGKNRGSRRAMGRKESGFGARLGKMSKKGQGGLEGPAKKGLCK